MTDSPEEVAQGPEQSQAEEESPRRKRRALLAAVGVAVMVLVIGLGAITWFGGDEPARKQLTEAAPLVSAPAAEPPVRLEVPSIDISARINPITVSKQRVLEPPADVSAVGWWNLSAQAGSDRGRTVMTGHTVHSGGGVMDRLDELEPGATVRVVTREGTFLYRTEKVQVRSKAWVAENAQLLFGQTTGKGRLVLISCEDWNGKVFESNVIAIAVPVTGSEPSDGTSVEPSVEPSDGPSAEPSSKPSSAQA